jgi:hypothetical protein
VQKSRTKETTVKHGFLLEETRECMFWVFGKFLSAFPGMGSLGSMDLKIACHHLTIIAEHKLFDLSECVDVIEF